MRATRPLWWRTRWGLRCYWARQRLLWKLMRMLKRENMAMWHWLKDLERWHFPKLWWKMWQNCAANAWCLPLFLRDCAMKSKLRSNKDNKRFCFLIAVVTVRCCNVAVVDGRHTARAAMCRSRFIWKWRKWCVTIVALTMIFPPIVRNANKLICATLGQERRRLKRPLKLVFQKRKWDAWI